MTRPQAQTTNRGPHASLADQVFDALKRDIVENRLAADTVLAEVNVASQYGVSRAPAREALKRLATLGFVRAIPRLGYMVTTVSLRDFDEIIALRIVLEPLAVELAVPRLADHDLDALEALARSALDVASAPPETHGALYAQLNAAFHRQIADASGNRRLARTISSLIDELERLMHTLAYSDNLELVLREHLELIELMRTRDAVASSRLMRAQLEHDYQVMRDLARPVAIAASV